MPFHAPSRSFSILSTPIALLLAVIAVVSPSFEDASGASKFGTSLTINTPWAGYVFGNVRLVDLDVDGFDEIIVGGLQFKCFSKIAQLSVFRRDLTTNRYTQLNYDQDGAFLGIGFGAYLFEALRRSGSVLPDIVTCGLTFPYSLTVLENHGGLNFSISEVAFSSVVAAMIYTLIAVADTDNDGSDEVFSSSQFGTDFFTRLPNATLITAASRFPVLPMLLRPAGTFAELDGDSTWS
jgi:hypothetical protein